VQQADGSRAQHYRGRRLRTAAGRSTGEDGRQSRAQMEDKAGRSTGGRGLTQQTWRTAQAGEDPPWRDPPLAADSTGGRRRRSCLGGRTADEDGALAAGAGAGDPPCRRDGDESGDPALAEDRRTWRRTAPWQGSAPGGGMEDGGKRMGWPRWQRSNGATAPKKWIRAGFRRKP
jgi:hypothetical protein